MSTFSIKIEKIVSGGYGFARHNDEVIFVPFAIPGETVKVEKTSQKKSFAFAKIVEIEEASPHRIEPKCSLFGSCGGCQFQMLPYEEQLPIKKSIIEEAVRRIGKMEVSVNDPIPSDNAFHYRNKGSFQVFKGSKLGYCYPGTSRPFEVKDCPIMEEAINQRFSEFWNNPEESKKLNGMQALTIRSNHVGETINSTIKRHSFDEKAAGLNFVVDVDTFFQVNRSIIPKWLGYIEELMMKHRVGKGLLDLYCGVGIISQFLAKDFDKVIGIEISKRLVQNGNAVLKKNNISNAEFIIADASKFYDYGFQYDTVIINPPRKGIDYNMVKTLSKGKPKVIIYSSCNPDTFARDIRQLCDNGYQIDEIQPFDMFPQTQHSEVVGVLYRD